MIITLTTDFGLTDPYVGIMKGIILGINPNVRIVDISHQIDAAAVRQAATMLRDACPYFPKGTIHVGVVDPGVGGSRRPILIKTLDAFFIGPDNGLFWPMINTQENVTIIHLNQKDFFLPHICNTFHGRDIFAPVAAHLSLGVDPHKMGLPIKDPMPLQFPTPQRDGGVLSGRIDRVDHFGTLITNISKKDIEKFTGTEQVEIWIGELTTSGIKQTYGDVDEGEVLALIGSSGYLEIAVNQGRADERVQGGSKTLIGMAVEVRRG